MNGYEYALNRGWDAANYAEAYGGPIVNHFLNTDDEAAFALGVTLFQNDQWQDGSPRD